MKAKIILSSIFLSASLIGYAQEVMNVNLNNGASVKYNVDEIKDITFEEPTAPVEPPVQDKGVKVASINDIQFKYDSQGRCTSIVYTDEDVDYSFDYSSGIFSCMGFPVGKFTLTGSGYLQTLEINFLGAWSKMTMEYTPEGRLALVIADSIDEDGPYSLTDHITWKDGLLTQVQEWQKDEDGEEEYLLNFTYSDKENSLGQFTLGMMNEGDLPLQVTGLFGKAPVKFPSSSKWDSDPVQKISYSFNSDGTVATETVGGYDYNYTYNTRAAMPAERSVKRALGRLIRKAR